jgi:hypothetical protein
MPLPLDPEQGSQAGMFEAEAAFVEADAVAEVAKDLLYEFNDLITLREAVDAGDVVLGYWFDTKPYKADEGMEHDTVGKAVKVPPFWRIYSGIDVVIQIRRDLWTAFNAEQRKALLYHELKHVGIVGEKKTLKMQEHSIEEFTAVALRFGAWLPSRAAFGDALAELAKVTAAE